jgi:hypothetical protein
MVRREAVPRNPRQDTRARVRPASECTRVDHASRSESSQSSRATMACNYCPFTGAVGDAEDQYTRGWCGVLESEASLPPLTSLAQRFSGKLSERARSKRYPPHLQGCAFEVYSGIAPPELSVGRGQACICEGTGINDDSDGQGKVILTI